MLWLPVKPGQTSLFMDNEKVILDSLPFLERELLTEISEVGVIKQIPSGEVIIHEGQYIKYLPIIIDGIIKVYSQFDDKELLLYYIEPKQSCIISFAAAIYNQPSRIFAVTEKPAKVLLVPAGCINGWISKYPKFNQLFFDLYHHRYLDLLDTINQLIFNTLDRRILTYLEEKRRLSHSDVINIRHHQIARDLGTAREVVTRIIKKLELEGKVGQDSNGIRILHSGD